MLIFGKKVGSRFIHQGCTQQARKLAFNKPKRLHKTYLQPENIATKYSFRMELRGEGFK